VVIEKVNSECEDSATVTAAVCSERLNVLLDVYNTRDWPLVWKDATKLEISGKCRGSKFYQGKAFAWEKVYCHV